MSLLTLCKGEIPSLPLHCHAIVAVSEPSNFSTKSARLAFQLCHRAHPFTGSKSLQEMTCLALTSSYQRPEILMPLVLDTTILAVQ